ncbi:MAG: tripartite tricarboxylate transporter substrate-binding protein [Xanthobacteraceae bacterium]
MPHIEGELLKASAKIEMNHVPYRGGGEALTGLLAGQVQVMFSVLTQMLPYIQEGRLGGLAISSATRSKLAPEIPTMVESGFDQFVTTSINGLVAPPQHAHRNQTAAERSRKSRARLGGRSAVTREHRRRGATLVAGRIRVLPGRGPTALGSHHNSHTHLD